MKSEILKILGEIEKEQNVRIIYACESGSRMWGFSNEGSDYDVRFIYIHNDLKNYISLSRASDVIEYEDAKLDIVGWDIKKSLYLHFKSNPNLREWLCSKTVYIDRGIDAIFSGLGGFSRSILKNHYRSIALKHWRKYSGLEFTSKKTKKYLYIIRSIMCWNILNHGACPPVNIHELLSHDLCGIPDEIRTVVGNLISYHQKSGEIKEEEIFMLNNFIVSSLSSMEFENTLNDKDLNLYDKKLREILLMRW